MIIFAWRGFPQYAARCVGAFVRSTNEEVVVVATRPKVPIEGMEKVSGCLVCWIDANDRNVKISIPFDRTTKLIVSGWGIIAFNQLAIEARKGGGKVFCMNDANMVLTLKECIRALQFRLIYRNKFDGFLVPGKSGRRLMRFYGVPNNRIAEGLYSADPSLFRDGPPILNRSKRIVYVGQLCDRKNVLSVCRAFIVSGIANWGWSLDLYGSGPQKEDLLALTHNPLTPVTHIAIHDFVQPERLVSIYQNARVFILASKEEHWGLVVHEAAFSGCYLLLSNRVGAGDDLLSGENGVSFNPFIENEIVRVFSHLVEMSDSDWAVAHKKSIDMANRINPVGFIQGVNKLFAM